MLEVQMQTRSENQLERTDYNDRIVVKCNGETIIDVIETEPGKLKDLYKIPELIALAYEAGRSNRDLVSETSDIEE